MFSTHITIYFFAHELTETLHPSAAALSRGRDTEPIVAPVKKFAQPRFGGSLSFQPFRHRIVVSHLRETVNCCFELQPLTQFLFIYSLQLIPGKRKKKSTVLSHTYVDCRPVLKVCRVTRDRVVAWLSVVVLFCFLLRSGLKDMR